MSKPSRVGVILVCLNNHCGQGNAATEALLFCFFSSISFGQSHQSLDKKRDGICFGFKRRRLKYQNVPASNNPTSVDTKVYTGFCSGAS